MTDTPATQPASTHDFIAYHVRNRDNKKSVWTRIGAAWKHADGKGFNIQFDVVPLDGRITLRVPSDNQD